MYIIWMVDSRCKCFYCIYSTVISIYESLSIHSTLQKKTAKNVNATTTNNQFFLLVMKKYRRQKKTKSTNTNA